MRETESSRTGPRPVGPDEPRAIKQLEAERRAYVDRAMKVVGVSIIVAAFAWKFIGGVGVAVGIGVFLVLSGNMPWPPPKAPQ